MSIENDIMVEGRGGLSNLITLAEPTVPRCHKVLRNGTIMSLIHKRDQIGCLATGVSTDITDFLRVGSICCLLIFLFLRFLVLLTMIVSSGLHICSLQLIYLLC